MGSKKRPANSTGEETEALTETPRDGSKSEAEAEAPSSSSLPNSRKPMERRKKRKALDKERHRAAVPSSSSDTPKPNPNPNLVDEEKRVSTRLPEFHVGVFKDLTSANSGTREAAVEKMVMELVEVQKAYDGIEKEELEESGLQLEAEKDDGLNNCAPSLRYAIRRLIRGVSSSRECARQGFALGLSLLVGRISSIKVDSLLKLVGNLLEVSSSMKGQEARDCLLGRLFAYGAIARSGRLTAEWISNKDTAHVREFTSLLVSLASKKKYLQEPAVAVILGMVESLPVEALSKEVLGAPGVSEWFAAAIEAGNPDALLLALKLREKTAEDNLLFGELLPHPFSTSKFFSADYLSTLVNCLKESTFCQPRVHSIWPALVNMLLPESVIQDDASAGLNSIKKHKKSRKSSSTEDVEKNLQSFSEVIIEGSLLQSSHDRKHLAFDVLLLLLPRLPASCITIVLSYRLVQCLMDILSTKDTWLYKMAQYFLKELREWVTNEDARRVAVIVALQKHSGGKFDCITRTKTVKDLMTEFKTESGCMLFIQNLMNMFVDDGHASDEPSDQSQTTDDNSEIGSNEDKDSAGTLGNSDFFKSWIIESVSSVLKYLKLEPEEKFRVQKEILKFLTVQGLFSASLGTEVTSFELQEKFRWPKATISSALCMMCIEQLQALLANAQKEGPLHGLEQNDLGAYVMRFVRTLCNIPSISLFRSLNDEEDKVLKKMQAAESFLFSEEKNAELGPDASRTNSLRYWLIQLLLQVLLRPGEFSEAANELVMCCKEGFAASNFLDSSGEDEIDHENEPEFIDVLLDTMLSLLPHSSAPLRSCIEQAFKSFSDDFLDEQLLRMLRIIKKDLKPARHAEDHDNDDDDDDFLEIEETDEADMSETAESDEQTDDSEAVAAVEAVGEEFPDVSDASDGSDDSDGDMDDEAMFRMDSYLARIFKERKNQAGGMPGVLTVYSNLAQAFVNPHTSEGSEQLGQRIWGIIQKKIFTAKRLPNGSEVNLSVLEPLLERNLKLASKPFKRKKSASNPSKKQSAFWNRHKMITKLAQESTFWLLKIIDATKNSNEELQRVFEIFQHTLVDYFDNKKSQLKVDFLKEIVKRRQWVGHNIFGFLLEKCSSTKSAFRRVEALELVSEILKSLAPITSDESTHETSKKILKGHVPKLCNLVVELVSNMPEKQSRRAEVRKFCNKIFQIISTFNLTKLFLKGLAPEIQAACESQFGKSFLALKKSEQET
ncbi:DNA polymerase V/Myb-binding protein 1A [Dillenia turbinata]|uniref:DNA polymerase V/Myb-binding protein 1A n=1 Tax=Dillenia turbinata TaxID=194707 RepID=A0AAN8ZT26_9MAGN